MHEAYDILRAHGVQSTAQRAAVVRALLEHGDHPTADEIAAALQHEAPEVSRATVYNTLHRLEEAGLVVSRQLKEGRLVYDTNTQPHHHFVDLDTGEIRDIPWAALEVRGVEGLEGLEVDEIQVVVRGRRSRR